MSAPDDRFRTHAAHWWRCAQTYAVDPVGMAAGLLGSLGDAVDGPSQLLQLQVFVAREEDRVALDGAVKRACGPARPAVHTITQRPCSGARAAVMAWGVGPELSGRVAWPEPGVVVLADGDTELALFDVVTARGRGAVASDWWQECFAALEDRLRAIDRGIEDVAKTWSLFGHSAASPRAHFEAFNAVRAEVFAGRAFRLVPEERAVALPANTGVAMQQAGAALAFITFSSSGGPAHAMANPDQLAPSDYPPAEIATAPLFSRGVAVPAGAAGAELVLVAGTASVVGWQAVHPGDPLAQTRQAERLIARLLDSPDDTDPVLAKIVYVGDAASGAEVARVACGATAAPCVLVEAELSRPALRIEIDAVARRTRRCD